ncbi:ATP-binding protein [Desulfotignum phosphitoxidans]|nr:ATP-binding protein [Desulfotignum phosphitoxidans]
MASLNETPDKWSCRFHAGVSAMILGVCLVLMLGRPNPVSGEPHLKIGVPMGFPPFSYQDEGEKEVRGYSVDIMQILCTHLAVIPHYLVGRPEDLLFALTKGDIDLVIGVAPDLTRRRQTHTMEIIIYVKRHVFVYYPDGPGARAAIQPTKTVIVHGQPHLTTGRPNGSQDFIQARSVKEALMMVNAGLAKEFMDYSDDMATYLIGRYGLQNIRQTGVQMGRFPFTLMISNENQVLKSGLNQALGQAIKTGQLDQVRDKWLGKSYAAFLWEQFAPILMGSLSLAAGLMIFFLVWHISLKRKVTQITRELKISEERYRQLIESSPDMVFLIDRTGKIRMANTSAAEWLNIPEKELIGYDMKQLVTPEDTEKFHLFITHLFSDKMATLEIRLKNKAQKEITVEFLAATLKSTNTPPQLACCFARDLTQRKRMEQELIASERLATIGKMAAGVAHEVNNPIGIILAHTEDLISGELTGSEVEESLNAIRRNAIRAGSITRAILDQASSETAGKTHVDAARTVEACLYFLKPRLKKIIVIQDLTLEIHWIWGDENQLQQMFINLLLNAVESMNGEGTLRVSGTTVTDTVSDRHCIKIEDSGKGVPNKLRTQIFDPFFTRGKTQGVGLGLFVAQRIAAQHGGTICVHDSRLGGAALTVTLPSTSQKTTNEENHAFTDR